MARLHKRALWACRDRGHRRGYTAGDYQQIQWTRALEESLLEIRGRALPHMRGFYDRLEDLWCTNNPTLPSRGSALGGHLLKLRKKGVHVDGQRVREENVSVSPSRVRKDKQGSGDFTLNAPASHHGSSSSVETQGLTTQDGGQLQLNERERGTPEGTPPLRM